MKKLYLSILVAFILLFFKISWSSAQTCGCLADGFGGCWVDPPQNNCGSGRTPVCSYNNWCYCDCLINTPTPTNIPTPMIDCSCSNNYGAGRCDVDNYCGSGYVESCVVYPHCNEGCTCLLPTPTPNPGTCFCKTLGPCEPVEPDNCALNYTPSCDDFLCLPTSCTCLSPTPTPPITSVPPSCSSNCPPGAYSDYRYGRCLAGNNPDDPTPGVFDCWNTQTDCDSTHDCYCCKNQDAPPAPTRSYLNPLCSNSGISTAIGCIPVGNRDDFLAFILKWALGIAGGVAFILIIYSGFLYMTSGGDKQKVQAAKELMTAAISGLLLLIFSVFLLDLFGVRILRIPGL